MGNCFSFDLVLVSCFRGLTSRPCWSFTLLASKACQSQHGCDSLSSHMSPASIHCGKASVQQLWDPSQRAGGPSKPDILPAREVAKYPNSAWRAKMRQLLQRGGDAVPDAPLAPPFSYSTTGGNNGEYKR